MKLNKIAFAVVVNFINQIGSRELDGHDIKRLDELIDIDVPQPTVNRQIIDELMKAIHEGKKIEAIKAYREIFKGVGLKEAKDAIEKDWR